MDDRRGYALYQKAGLFAGPVVFVVALALPTPEGMTPEGQRAGAVALLMATWWITEALPLAATALLPIALFPVLGVLKTGAVTSEYGNVNIFLFAGGFFIAMAMQKWNLHERIALNIVLRTGTNPSRLVLGFMLATAFLSMWISNTATALMMLPIAIAVILQMEARAPQESDRFSIALLLSIAYGASIGGIATLIGTPPNGVLIAQFSVLFPEGPTIGFFQWMLFGLPLAAVLLPVTWLMLTRVLFNFREIHFPEAREEIAGRLGELGRMSRGETTVLVVWTLTALGWIFQNDIDLGVIVVPGWSDVLPVPEHMHNAAVAIAGAVALFVIPVNLRAGEFALDWNWAKRIPWDILILFGGGLALAAAFRETLLVEWLGGMLGALDGVPPVVVILCIALMLTFLTELTSNTATTTIMMPILGFAAVESLGVHPLLLMVPAAVSASCAFMLPVATPPNAIVFGAGKLSVPQMARAGLAINLIGAALVTVFVYFVAVPVFGIDLGAPPPEWAALPETR